MKSIIYIYYTYIGIGENIRFFRFGVLFSENIEQNMEKKLIKPMSKNKTNVIFFILTRCTTHRRRQAILCWILRLHSYRVSAQV